MVILLSREKNKESKNSPTPCRRQASGAGTKSTTKSGGVIEDLAHGKWVGIRNAVIQLQPNRCPLYVACLYPGVRGAGSGLNKDRPSRSEGGLTVAWLT